jgi:hypothetical protein
VRAEPSTGHVRGAPDWTEVEGWQPPDENDTITTTTNTTATGNSSPTATNAAATATGNTAAGAGAGAAAPAGLPRELPHIVNGFVSIFVVYAALATALSWGFSNNTNNNNTSSSKVGHAAAELDDTVGHPAVADKFERLLPPVAPRPTAATAGTTANSNSKSSSATPNASKPPPPQQPRPYEQDFRQSNGRGKSHFTSDTPLAFEKDSITGAWVQQSLLSAEDAAFRTGSVPYSSFAKLLAAKKRREAEAAAAAAAAKASADASGGNGQEEPLLSHGEVQVCLNFMLTLSNKPV